MIIRIIRLPLAADATIRFQRHDRECDEKATLIFFLSVFEELQVFIVLDSVGLHVSLSVLTVNLCLLLNKECTYFKHVSETKWFQTVIRIGRQSEQFTSASTLHLIALVQARQKPNIAASRQKRQFAKSSVWSLETAHHSAPTQKHNSCTLLRMSVSYTEVNQQQVINGRLENSITSQ